MKPMIKLIVFALSLNANLFAQKGWVWQNPLPQGGTILKTTTGGVVAVREKQDQFIPKEFVLSQNHPNPFSANGAFGNPETSIKYQLPNRAQVELVVYDLTGRRVATLASGLKPAGEHTVPWNGRDSAGKPCAERRLFLPSLSKLSQSIFRARNLRQPNNQHSL